MLITKAAAKKYNFSELAKVLKIYFHISAKNQSPFFYGLQIYANHIKYASI